MSVRRISCPGTVLFLASELSALHELDGGLRVEPALWCGLEAGHTGLHHAMAQSVLGTATSEPWNIWVRWPEDDEYGPLRELLRLESCTVRFLSGTVQEERCCLPEAHPGRHDFEFGPPLTQEDALPDDLFRQYFGD